MLVLTVLVDSHFQTKPISLALVLSISNKDSVTPNCNADLITLSLTPLKRVCASSVFIREMGSISAAGVISLSSSSRACCCLVLIVSNGVAMKAAGAAAMAPARIVHQMELTS